PHQFLQQCLSFNQRQDPEILSIQIKEIEREEHTLPFPKQQISKCWPARFIDTGNFVIEDRAFNFDVFHDPIGKLAKTAEGISVSGNEFCASILKVKQRAKPIDLEFINEVFGVERFRTAGKPYGT